jgi:very-short-patch-repair endonuclease
MKIKNVLVGVLKNKADLDILLKYHWYRIPVEFLPARKFKYIAFYQPVSFGKNGKRIEYYAAVSGKRKFKRIDLLPEEAGHPRANRDYFKFDFKKIIKLPKSVRNVIPRRVSFGFTDRKALLSAKNILELYGVPPTERIVEKYLKRAGIKAVREFGVAVNGKRFRVDLAVFRGKSKIAVECDNEKAHAGKTRAVKDKAKDSFLRRHGWRVVRLKECDMIERTDDCVKLVEKTIKAGEYKDNRGI